MKAQSYVAIATILATLMNSPAHARYYSAAGGRFLSPDTLVPNAEEPQSLNRYTYCQNNPLNLVDPNGHNPFAVIIAIAIVAGAVEGGTHGQPFQSSAWHNFDVQAAVIGGTVAGVSAGTGLGIAGALGPGTGLAADIGIAGLSGMGAGAAGYTTGVGLTGGSWKFNDFSRAVVLAGLSAAALGAATSPHFGPFLKGQENFIGKTQQAIAAQTETTFPPTQPTSEDSLAITSDIHRGELLTATEHPGFLRDSSGNLYDSGTGQLVGTPGNNPGIWHNQGDLNAARAYFDELRAGNPINEVQPATFVSQDKYGNTITFRSVSGAGNGPPTVDIHIGTIRKIKFLN